PTDPNEERVRMTPDIRLEFKLNVKAGPQQIGVAFLNKSYAANEDLVRRPVSSTYDVFIGMQYGYTTAPHLSRVVITGPYNPTGISNTSSRQHVFVCRSKVAADETPSASAKATAGSRRSSPEITASEDGCAKQIISTLARRAY